jgi:hypothetical protein
LTIFEYEALAMAGNGNYVNLLNFLGKICEITYSAVKNRLTAMLYFPRSVG